jgi:hypothetical protein
MLLCALASAGMCLRSRCLANESIRHNVILPSTLRYSNWTLAFKFSDYNLVFIPQPPSHACNTLSPSHPFYFITRIIIYGEKYNNYEHKYNAEAQEMPFVRSAAEVSKQMH